MDHHSGTRPLPLHLSTAAPAPWLDLTNDSEGRYPTPSGHRPSAARSQKVTMQMPCYRGEPAERGCAARNPQVARPSGRMAYLRQPGQAAAAARSASTAATSTDRDHDCPGLHEHSVASDEVLPATHGFLPSITGAKDSHPFTNGDPSQRSSGLNAAPSRSFTLGRARIKKPAILGAEVSGNDHPQWSPCGRRVTGNLRDDHREPTKNGLSPWIETTDSRAVGGDAHLGEIRERSSPRIFRRQCHTDSCQRVDLGLDVWHARCRSRSDRIRDEGVAGSHPVAFSGPLPSGVPRSIYRRRSRR